jgi:hypothetical protein
MPIEVQIGDTGQIAEFPDGTPEEVILQALAQFNQAPEAPRARAVGGRSGRGQRLQEQRLSERDQMLAALPPERRALLESISPGEAALIGLGRGFTDVSRGVGLMDQADDVERQAFRQLEEVQPLATGGQVVGQAAPFVPLGMVTGLPASTGLRALGTGVLGATEGAVITRGQGGDLGEQLFAAGIGGGVAGAIELGLPVIGRIGGKVIRRVTGKAPTGAVVDASGNPSPELLKALEVEGLQFDDLVAETTSQLRREAVDPEQAARKAFLESQGLTGEAAPTRAQISRSVDDFALQQEALKSSGRVEQRIAAQDRVLTTRFDDAIAETAGDPFLSTSSVSDSLVRKAGALDDEIGVLYKEARQAAPGDRVVRFDSLSQKVKELSPLNERSGGNVRAVFGTLQQKGLLDENFKPTGRLGIEETETQIRQFINSLYDQNKSGGDISNNVLREMKEALDDDVFRNAGQDLFNKARSAKASFEEGLKRAKISKFDTRAKNLVRDILENKDSVNPEQFSQKVVFSKGWRSTDLKQLKDYISTEGHGQAAWNDLKADVLQKIKERSFIGSEDASGFRSLSRDKIQKAIGDIGEEKLKILFDPAEVKFLKDMEKIAAFREPRKMTERGFGPSAKAVLSLEKKLSDLPLIGSVFGFMDLDPSGRLAVRSQAQKITKPIAGSQIRQAAALGGAAASTQALGDEQ